MAIAVSFCGAPAVSWLTVTAGGCTEVPSSGLLSTYGGLIGAAAGGALSSSASSSMNAENLIYRPAVPCSDATFPARVLMS
jgi:hypothetical protein